ncbi:DUF4031 domain-containing protein [Chryseobacterium phage MA9V-2]|nr:DUF4031 domain-containing protein [Chryseobacterium phage MA9V-2]
MLTYITDRKRHLICEPYSLENLHRMATELNINICWFHGGKYPHYDIPKRRIADIEERCKIVRPRELLQIIKDNQ